MNRNTKLKIITLCSILILLGIAFPFVNVIWFFVYLLIAIILAFASVIILLFAILDKSALRNALLIILSFISFIGSAWASESFIIYYKKNTGKEIIGKLESYNAIHKKYPEDLEQLKLNQNLQKVSYYTDTKNYSIEFEISDINRQLYDSKTKKWRTLGWND